eukprot:scaffold69486_cov63-Phaeocystis_antarctica.AAC.1
MVEVRTATEPPVRKCRRRLIPLIPAQAPPREWPAIAQVLAARRAAMGRRWRGRRATRSGRARAAWWQAAPRRAAWRQAPPGSARYT